MSRSTYIKKKFYSVYQDLNRSNYEASKRRLQSEVLMLHQWVVDNNKRVAITFDGRDAAGKGGAIKRFIEYLMPHYFRVIELGVPTKKESRNWFGRYKKHMPNKGEIVFFDRSWYNRALIEPTMGYCTERQYRYFMDQVLNWEEKNISDGLISLFEIFIIEGFVLGGSMSSEPFDLIDLITSDIQKRNKHTLGYTACYIL